MNTIFTVTTGAKTADAKGFSINLGQDVLDGVHEATIREMAARSKVINIQAPLRKFKSAEEMETYLHKNGYVNATVTEGVVKEPSVNATAKALAAMLSPEEIQEMIERKIAEKQSA